MIYMPSECEITKRAKWYDNLAKRIRHSGIQLGPTIILISGRISKSYPFLLHRLLLGGGASLNKFSQFQVLSPVRHR
jgi:hypothetical protein